MPPSLPAWVSYVQALGPTIATVSIAFFTIWIGFRQVGLAREKIAHDLYDRRYAIYLVFETMIRVLMGQKGLGTEEDVVLAANVAAHQSRFILNDYIAEYLLGLNAIGWRRVNAHEPEVRENLKNLPPDERLKRLQQHEQDVKDILAAAPVLAEKFRPFLRLRDFRR